MILDDIQFYLESLDLDIPTIYKGGFPDAPDDAVSLDEGPGGRPDYVLGSPIAKLENPRIQVLCRSKTKANARAYAERIYQALQVYDEEMESSRYVFIVAVQSPFTSGRDEDNRWVEAVNFDAKKDLGSDAVLT